MVWYYNKSEFTEDMIGDNVGFVYMITNLTNGKKYIGKKRFTQTRKKPATKKRRAKRVTSASDWQTYVGSNKALQEDINTLGIDNFLKEILYLCKNKGWMSYYEAKAQFDNGVLLSDCFYNGIISCRINKNHL